MEAARVRIRVRIATLVRGALAEVCTVPVLLVIIMIIIIVIIIVVITCLDGGEIG